MHKYITKTVLCSSVLLLSACGSLITGSSQSPATVTTAGDADIQAAPAALNMVALNYLKEELPQGFDTILGRRFDGGQQLSIGQWQRLATARALYKKPGLLVLDEPTASVDAVSEKAMFEALRAIDYQLTILLVAHRFTTICHAEKIIVLDGGKVVGCGDHATLLKSCKFYADMFHAQNSYN